MSCSNKHVIVGMSGGVDSSVTALLLKQQGYQVSGLFMKNWNDDDGTEHCTTVQDLIDAQSVCDRIDIPLYTTNFAEEYWNDVFSHCLNEYRQGRTPNPDILCNREIKFKAFYQHAVTLGADMIATGHYARLRKSNNDINLLKGLDTTKDQSYFLYAVTADQFANVLFPIGEKEKSDIRQIAKENQLIVHSKKDSTGICFIGERRFSEFLQRYIPTKPGLIETDNGKIIGEHHGIMYYTIGQRHGLGIGGQHDAKESPWYIAKKDCQRNTLTVVQGNNHPLLFSSKLTASSIHWISKHEPVLPFYCKAKIRYRQIEQDCTITKTSDQQYEVCFSHPQRAVTPGQSVVFYDGDICLGGGIIELTSQ